MTPSRRVSAILVGVLEREGSAYTNNPADSGGPTKYGVTQRTLSRYRGRPVSAAAVEALTESEAFNVYHAMFVEAPGYAQVVPLSEAIAEELVDTGVNSGPGRASEFLQRALNALNRNGRDYADVKVDGDLGPATLAALRAYLAKRGKEGETVMLRALNCLQGAFYIELAEKRPKDEEFAYGWLRNRVTIQ